MPFSNLAINFTLPPIGIGEKHMNHSSYDWARASKPCQGDFRVK